MRTIWKIVLPDPGDINWKTLPLGAQVRHVGIQDGAMCAWVEVESEAPPVDIAIHVTGTGWPVPVDSFYGDDVYLEHRGTIQVSGFVWHVWQGVPA